MMLPASSFLMAQEAGRETNTEQHKTTWRMLSIDKLWYRTIPYLVKKYKSMRPSWGQAGVSFFVRDSHHLPMIFNVGWEFNTKFCGMSMQLPWEGNRRASNHHLRGAYHTQQKCMPSLQRHSRIYLERERQKIETTPRPKTSCLPSLQAYLSKSFPSQSLQRN